MVKKEEKRGAPIQITIGRRLESRKKKIEGDLAGQQGRGHN